MILQGKVPITWSGQDYEDVLYKSHPNPYRGFDASAQIKQNSNLKLDVHICYDVNQNIKKCLEQFKLNNVAIQLQKYLPGDYLPFHKDTYATYKKHYDIKDTDTVVRIIVFLHDQTPGQQLWIDDKMYYGNCGSYFGWTNNTEHMAANLSSQPRYNLQITGTSTF